MIKHNKIAVIIPCFKVGKSINTLLSRFESFVDFIIVVDDSCPNKTFSYVPLNRKKIIVIRNSKNLGVGGAVIAGYREALRLGADIFVKIDGDGQMDPQICHKFISPILSGRADYTKGNRFYNVDDVIKMPLIRIIGNAALSFITKFSTGYWNIFDPTNGYTAIHRVVLLRIPLDKVSNRYFFESDMLFRLGTIRAKVEDVPMTAHYKNEVSNLKVSSVLFEFILKHLKNFFKRIFYNYFLRDFNVASLELLIGLSFIFVGSTMGFKSWYNSYEFNIAAPYGTMMLASVLIILGVNLLLSFLNFDIQSTPTAPIHKNFED